MTIRQAKPADAEAVGRLSGQLGYPATPEEARASLERLGRDDRHAVFVAERDGAVVAWLHVCRKEALGAADYAEITGLVVDEQRRGGGVGAALVARAEAWTRERGLGRLRVRSNVVRERAHAFYERLGFATAKSQVVFDKTLGASAAAPAP